MRRPSLSEILTSVAKPSVFKDRLKELKKHKDNHALLTLLHYTYHPQIKFLLPEGDPPYKENDFPDQEGLLYRNIKQLQYFVERPNDRLTPAKREQIFVSLLETVDKDDAKLLLGMKDKDIRIEGITSKLAENAFPQIFK